MPIILGNYSESIAARETVRPQGPRARYPSLNAARQEQSGLKKCWAAPLRGAVSQSTGESNRTPRRNQTISASMNLEHRLMDVSPASGGLESHSKGSCKRGNTKV